MWLEGIEFVEGKTQMARSICELTVNMTVFLNTLKVKQ